MEAAAHAAEIGGSDEEEARQTIAEAFDAWCVEMTETKTCWDYYGEPHQILPGDKIILHFDEQIYSFWNDGDVAQVHYVDEEGDIFFRSLEDGQEEGFSAWVYANENCAEGSDRSWEPYVEG